MQNIIQLLSVLSSIQGQRQQMEMAQQRMNQEREQFAERLGFDKKSQQYKEIDTFLSRYGDSAIEQRGALDGLARTLFRDDPEAAQALMEYGANAPQSLNMLRTQAANRGAQQATPTMDREAYVGATTGMNQGQLGQSQVGSALTGNLLDQMTNNPGMATQMAQGFGQKLATGETPFQAAKAGVIMNNPNALTTAAGIDAGLIRNAGQELQRELGFANLNAMAAEIASKKAAAGALTPEDVTRGLAAMREARETIANPKLNPALRTQGIAEYNRLAESIGMTSMKINSEEAADTPSFYRNLNPFGWGSGGTQGSAPINPVQAITPGAGRSW